MSDSTAAIMGRAVLNDPTLGNGTAFRAVDGRELGLDGLLPPRIETLAELPTTKAMRP